MTSLPPKMSSQIMDWESIWGQESRLAEKARSRLSDEVLPIMTQFLPKTGVILEAGCGPADWVLCLQSLGYSVIGFDFCESVLLSAQAQVAGLPLMVGDVLSIGLQNDSVDAIISLGVIEHFEGGPYGALREAYRVLKPGGVMLVSVPHMNGLRRLPFAERLKKSTWFRKLTGKKLTFWQYKFTLNQFVGFLKTTGFTVEELRPLYHEEGLVFDVPLLKSRTDLYKANRFGKAICHTLKRISPWITDHMVMAIVRKPI